MGALGVALHRRPFGMNSWLGRVASAHGDQDVVLDSVSAPHAEFPHELDQESRLWFERLGSTGPQQADAVEALFELLHHGARHEANRRRGSLPPAIVSELDDLARQAADDAVTAVLRKLADYRGASRFTTWAWKFAILEVSATLRRAAWRGRAITIDDAAWGRLADSMPVDPLAAVEARELVAALERSVTTDLTPLQRDVFVAVVVLHAPVDVVANRRGTTRGAIYKALHDGRRTLRRALAAQGWAVDETGGAP
jgi:RNA polymerase sigma-70 factor (ECF subfamily)